MSDPFKYSNAMFISLVVLFYSCALWIIIFVPAIDYRLSSFLIAIFYIFLVQKFLQSQSRWMFYIASMPFLLYFSERMNKQLLGFDTLVFMAVAVIGLVLGWHNRVR